MLFVPRNDASMAQNGCIMMYICKQKSNKINVLWINWYPNDLNPCHAARPMDPLLASVSEVEALE